MLESSNFCKSLYIVLRKYFTWMPNFWNIWHCVQVAYTTSYGPVMPGYPTEPIMTESQLDTNTCIYQTNDNCMSTGVDDSACYEAVSGKFAAHLYSTDCAV